MIPMNTFNIILLLLLAIVHIAAASEAQYQGALLTTADEVKIHAVRFTTGKDTILIYCHKLLSSKESFHQKGFGDVLFSEFDVLTFDFRGHHQSAGISTRGGDEVLDLRAAVQYAIKKGYKKIVLLGIGMGGTVAIREAAMFGNADAVIAISPLGQPERFKPWRWNLVANAVLNSDYFRSPYRILTGMRIKNRYLTGNPIYLIDRISPTPLLIIHGQAYTDLKQIQRLYDSAQDPKKLIILQKSECRANLLNEVTAKLIIAWIKETLSTSPPPNPLADELRSRPATAIKKVKIQSDIPLPDKFIEEIAKTSSEGASNLYEQLNRAKETMEKLYKAQGYTLSRVSNIQISEDSQLSLKAEIDKVKSVAVAGDLRAMPEKSWYKIQPIKGEYYNAWEIENTMKLMSEKFKYLRFESQLNRDSNGNEVQILIKEQNPLLWKITGDFDGFDSFGGVKASLNSSRPNAWKVYGKTVTRLRDLDPFHRNYHYIVIYKSWFRKESLSTRFNYSKAISRNSQLNYYFPKLDVRERGGGAEMIYKINDNTTINSGISRRHFEQIKKYMISPSGDGFINALAFRLENRERLLQKGDLSFSLHSLAFLETATTRAGSDYEYSVFQLNLYPKLALSQNQALNFGLHWGTSWNEPPPHKLFSLGDINTLPGYGYDAILGERFFLVRSRYDLKVGKWIGEYSRFGPLDVSFLFDAGNAGLKSEPLKSPQLELGVELNYASVIRFGLVKSIGKKRVAPYVYFGWYPDLSLLQIK